jgi:hypothetical protein
MENTVTELAKKFATLKAEHESQSEVLKKINAEWEDIEARLLDAMVEDGTKSLHIDGLGLFTMAVTNYLSVNAASKETFYPYLKESGNGGILKEDVNARTLTAFLKGHLEDKIREFESSGLDGVDARNKALEFLNSKGASYFTKREIRMTKK